MPPKPELTALAAARLILEQAAAPLHYEETTKRILASSLWHTSGKTPAASSTPFPCSNYETPLPVLNQTSQASTRFSETSP